MQGNRFRDPVIKNLNNQILLLLLTKTFDFVKKLSLVLFIRNITINFRSYGTLTNLLFWDPEKAQICAVKPEPIWRIL